MQECSRYSSGFLHLFKNALGILVARCMSCIAWYTSSDYLIKPFSVCPEVLSNINKIVTINSSRTHVRLGAWFWSAKADIFFSESLHILAEHLSQSEIELPLRKICYYSPLAEVGVSTQTEIKNTVHPRHSQSAHSGFPVAALLSLLIKKRSLHHYVLR